jgi:acyl-CoA synthetase (AMP-forming)/AMP-acid ligase II
MDQATYDRLLAKARRTIDLFTFDEFIRFWGNDRPNMMALDGDYLSLTYGELEEATARVASALLAMGIRKGDRVAWFGKNATTYFTLFFGAARAGIVMVPIGWRLAEPEAAFILDNAEAKVLFLGDGFEACANTLGKRPSAQADAGRAAR